VRLEGAAALVTGAGTRIGQAIAIGLAQAGCDVAIHYHGSARGAEETARQVREAGASERGGRAGRRAALLQADLTDAARARSLADEAARALQRLDIVVNSAAIMVRERVEDVTPESWNATLDLNLRAMFFVSQGAIAHLRRARGKIINIADLAGLEPWPTYIPHSVSKAGVVMLTKALARALAPDIAVNAVAPGAVLLPEDGDPQTRDHIRDTTPLARLGSPADVVAAVRFLLEGTDYATGTVLVIDGGRLIR
jgi:pteridine reductase